MKRTEVAEMLSNDISCIKLPPISDKVLQAVRSKKQEDPEADESVPESHNTSTVRLTKYLFAAMLLLLAISIPIIVVLSTNNKISEVIDNSQTFNTFSKVSDDAEKSEQERSLVSEGSKRTLDTIKMKKLCGDVALSAKSDQELENLLTSYSKQNDVYEDSEYIYNFNIQGKLIEICRNNPDYSPANIYTADKEYIAQKSEEIIKDIFPAMLEQEMIIEGSEDSLPAWFVTVCKKNDDLSLEQITLSYDGTGTLLRVNITQEPDSIGKISSSEAIRLTLKEIRMPKYNVPEFDDDSVEIYVNVKEISDKLMYIVFVNDIPSNTYCVTLVDPDTGNVTMLEA